MNVKFQEIVTLRRFGKMLYPFLLLGKGGSPVFVFIKRMARMRGYSIPAGMNIRALGLV
jgi:hypothetical protein